MKLTLKCKRQNEASEARRVVVVIAQLPNFVIATNEFRGSGAGERTEYHNLVAWV